MHKLNRHKDDSVLWQIEKLALMFTGLLMIYRV